MKPLDSLGFEGDEGVVVTLKEDLVRSAQRIHKSLKNWNGE